MVQGLRPLQRMSLYTDWGRSHQEDFSIGVILSDVLQKHSGGSLGHSLMGLRMEKGFVGKLGGGRQELTVA